MGLAQCLNAPGGIDVAQACARAEENLDGVRTSALAMVDDCLGDIADVCTGGAPPSLELRRELHRLSCTIAGLAGMFGREALSKAAYCFCRLIDDTAPGWDGVAAGVHVASMRLLFSPELVAPARQNEILEGLMKVRRRAGVAPRV